MNEHIICFMFTKGLYSSYAYLYVCIIHIKMCYVWGKQKMVSNTIDEACMNLRQYLSKGAEFISGEHKGWYRDNEVRLLSKYGNSKPVYDKSYGMKLAYVGCK